MQLNINYNKISKLHIFQKSSLNFSKSSNLLSKTYSYRTRDLLSLYLMLVRDVSMLSQVFFETLQANSN